MQNEGENGIEYKVQGQAQEYMGTKSVTKNQKGPKNPGLLSNLTCNS